MQLRHLRWKGEYLVFRTFACVIEVLNHRQVARIARLLAWVMTCVLPRRVTRYQVALENLQAAFPDMSRAEIDDVIFRMWEHLFRLVAEVVQFPRKFRLENCREVVVFRNRAASVKAMLSGRPVIFVGGHYGNWEASTATFGLFGFRMGIVARKLDNPYLHDWFVRARESTGHRLLLKDGGWDGMLDIIQAGGALGLLGDQDAGKRGVFVNFFNRPASTYRSLALLALEHKALIVIGYGRRLPDDFENARWSRFEIGCEAVIDPTEIHSDDEVKTVAELYSQALERAIRRSPEQYFWVHRRWKSVPRVRKEMPLRRAG